MTRGRRPNIEPSVALNVSLPEPWRVRLDLLLFSESEQRVPKGAYRQFFIERLADFFGTRELDLSPFLGSLPGERTIRGKPETVEALAALLKAAK